MIVAAVAVMFVGVALLGASAPRIAWDAHAERGLGPPADLRAGQPYYLQVTAGCQEGARYTVTVELVDLSTGAVAWKSDAVVADFGEGCLAGTFGEIRVPHDGPYLFSWAMPAGLAAQAPHFALQALRVPLGAINGLLGAGAVLLFLALPVLVVAKWKERFGEPRPPAKDDDDKSPEGGQSVQSPRP